MQLDFFWKILDVHLVFQDDKKRKEKENIIVLKYILNSQNIGVVQC